jgi:hypothetical protein
MFKVLMVERIQWCMALKIDKFERQDSRRPMILRVQPTCSKFSWLVLNIRMKCETKLFWLERLKWCMVLKSVKPNEQRFSVLDCHPCEERSEFDTRFLDEAHGDFCHCS